LLLALKRFICLINEFVSISSRPCDIVGDISYEELRAAAYEDARKGLPVQAIVSPTIFCPLCGKRKSLNA